jgi:drug/metabolite transporter (DMT)-like permease
MKNYQRRQLFGALVIFSGMGLAFFSDVPQQLAYGVINGGTIFMLINYATGKKIRGKLKDEWSVKLSRASLAHSWVFTFFLLNILLWLDFGGLTNFEPLVYFGILFAGMLLSSNLYYFYYRHKGDAA